MYYGSNGKIKILTPDKFSWNRYHIVPYYVWKVYNTEYLFYSTSCYSSPTFISELSTAITLPYTIKDGYANNWHWAFTANLNGLAPKLIKTDDHLFLNRGGYEIDPSEWNTYSSLRIDGIQQSNGYVWYLTSVAGVTSGKVYLFTGDVLEKDGKYYIENYITSTDDLSSSYGCPAVIRTIHSTTRLYSVSFTEVHGHPVTMYYNDYTQRPTTIYGSVSNPTSTAYPSDGLSGSYWYIKQSNTIDGKGDFIDVVYDEDSSVYPISGAQDCFWYEIM